MIIKIIANCFLILLRTRNCLGAFHALKHLIIKIELGHRYNNYPHFTDVKTESYNKNNEEEMKQ